jgi:hypothetical protein
VANLLQSIVRTLLGISAYQGPTNDLGAAQYPQLGDAHVDEIRKALGGNIQPVTTTKLRWYLADLEAAQISADAGYMRPAAQLCRAMRRDGVVSGLLGTRSGGLIRLPNTFYGDAAIVSDLKSLNGTRSVFDEMVPPAELQALNDDGLYLGVGVAELVPVEGRDYPVLVRLDPEYLRYRWNENRWYFESVAGLLPITPGDGRWVLHMPGARMSPWLYGMWSALGRSFINKEHALLHRSNYSAKLANPARLAFAPNGANEAQRLGFFKKLLAWATNTVIELPPGYDAKLLESNGRGSDVFQKEIDTSDNEITVCVAGQTVTVDGGAGFQNGDIYKTIREDLIKRDATALEYTCNTQILPQFIARRYGEAAITRRATGIQWDTRAPKELEAQARTLQQVTQALVGLRDVLTGSNRALDLDALATQFSIPLRNLDAAPARLAEVITQTPTPGESTEAKAEREAA